MISNGIPFDIANKLYDYIKPEEIAMKYLGITHIPFKIKSPLREDRNPSLCFLFSKEGNFYVTDYGTNEVWSIIGFLSEVWGIDRMSTIEKIYIDFLLKRFDLIKLNSSSRIYKKNSSPFNVVCREWTDNDILYWSSYGINLNALNYAEVFPIKHIVFNDNYIIKSDKYAYAFVEHKDNNQTIKVYQPYNTNGLKWISKHTKDVISLYSKIPERDMNLCICSSVKDALCLWCNTGIPSIALQGEGYPINPKVVEELKNRFKRIFICFDNDNTGIKDAIILANKTNFINVVLPPFSGGKDISDLYFVTKDSTKFKDKMLTIFKKCIV